MPMDLLRSLQAGSYVSTTSTSSRIGFSWGSLLRLASVGFTLILLLVGTLHAQTDPGPRPSAGGNAKRLPLADSVDMQKFWGGGQNVFKQLFSVSGNSAANNITGEPGVGLGPAFNGDSCAMCHSQPTVGGTSPSTNPEVGVANMDGATNAIPSFITANGPVREARFILNQNRLDGGVHNLFTIAGRSDAAGCNLAQPNFAQQLANGNVIFRIPTPVFGLGLVENTPDSILQANLSANQSAKAKLGIAGRFNASGNDGTITRFGWKAQNKSLAVFAGEALNVELGVSNENFSNERSAVAGCVFNNTPEDSTPATGPNGSPGATTGTATQMASAMENIAIFMRFNAPPAPATPPFVTENGTSISQASVTNGQNLFSSVGCASCHSPSLTTAASQFQDLSNVAYQPYSDFALHHMGDNLADGVNQGIAGPDEFRTAPLWGLGQRLFFLHDGRASDLLSAIEAHASPLRDCVSVTSLETFEVAGDFFAPLSPTVFCGSEANAVINNFNALSASNQQDVLNFLRSL
jgi:CxxC motif-containing protein (DUF1111 family)